jgi:hypothetical protein
MDIENNFALAFDAVAEMMEAAKPSPQKEKIEAFLDTTLDFVKHLKAVADKDKRQYITNHNNTGPRYEVKADTHVQNQLNQYSEIKTTLNNIHLRQEAEWWTIPGKTPGSTIPINMNQVEYYDKEIKEISFKSGRVMALTDNQVNRFLSWYYMKGIMKPPKPPVIYHEPEPLTRQQLAQIDSIILQINTELKNNGKTLFSSYQ